MSFHSICAILYKDLLDVVRSKAVWVSLSVPIILSVFFSLAFSTPDILPEIGFYDSGNSEFGNFLDKSGLFRVKEVQSEAEARKKLSEGKWAGVLILPPDFDKDIEEFSRPKIHVLLDNSIMGRSKIILMGLGEMVRLYAKQSYPVKMRIEVVRKNKLKEQQELLPIWILLTVMGSLVVTTSSLMEEKEKKTLYALLVSPASIYDVVIGKGLLGVILTFTSSLLLLTLNKGLTGNLFFLVSILLLGAICFSIWGVFVALVSSGQTTANSINSLIFIFLMIPLVLCDKSNILLKLSKLLPSFYLVDGIRKSMEGTCGFYSLYINYVVLVLFSAMLFIICLKIISRQEN